MQVNCRHHPERSYDHCHQQHHEHGTEDSREYTAFGVGFARIVRNKLADLVEPEADLGQQRHVVRPVDIQHVGQRHRHVLTAHVLDDQTVTGRLLAQCKQLLLQHMILFIQGLTFTGNLLLGFSRQLKIQLQAPLLETQLLQLIVDAANLGLLQSIDLLVDLGNSGNASL